MRFEPPSTSSHALTLLSGVKQTRVHKHEYTSAILDIFQKHGHNETDTARYYGQGSLEEYFGQLQWQKRGHQVLPNRGTKYAR